MTFRNWMLTSLMTLLFGGMCTTSLASSSFTFYQQTIPIGAPAEAMIMEDLNGDRRTDIAILTSESTDGSDFDYRVLVYHQQLNGTLSDPVAYTGGNGTDLAAGDMNGDGRTDLVIPLSSGFGILYQLTDGTLTQPVVFNGQTANRLAVGDINHDGRLDVVTINQALGSSTFLAYRQTSTGFAPYQQYYVMVGADIRIADANGDGLEDVIMLGQNGVLSFLAQTSSGSLSPPVSFTPDGTFTGETLLVTDLNRDHVKDLVCVLSSGTQATVLLYAGGESFPTDPEVYTGLAYPACVAAGDINLDGRPDVALTHQGGNWLGIFRQGTSGTLLTEEFQDVPDTETYGIRTVAIGDINNDGMPDIVLADSDNGLTILRQRVTLWIPHVAVESVWETNLVMNNVGTTMADTVVTVYRPGLGDRNYGFQIQPGQSIHLPFSLGECGKVEYTGGRLVTKAVYVNNQPDGQGIAEFLLNGQRSPELQIPLPAYNAENLTWMGIAIFNATTVTADVTLRALDVNGNALGTADIQIPGRQRAVGVLDTFFPEIDIMRTGRIVATSNQSLTGLAISGQNNEKLLFAPGVTDLSGGTRIIPHIAQISEGWTSWLILDNTTDSNQTVSLQVLGDGGVLANGTYLVGSGDSRTVSLDDLVTEQALVEAALVTVPNGVIAREAFVNIDAGGGGTAEFLLSDAAGERLVLGYPFYAADQMTWWGVAVFNYSDTIQTVYIRSYVNDNLARATSVDIQPYGRFRSLLTDLYPDFDPSQVNRVIITGDHLLSGLNISGAGTSRLLFTPADPR